MKGITPVVAIILLLLVTISIVGFAMVFFQRNIQQTSLGGEQNLQNQIASASVIFDISSTYQDKVYVRNIGSGLLSDIKFYLNNQEMSSSPVSVPSGTVGEVTVSGLVISYNKPVVASYSPNFGSASLITNSVFAPEGTGWNNPAYAVSLNSAGSGTNLKIDIGSVRNANRVRIQADDNDNYMIEYSTDEFVWLPLYSVPFASGGGLRTRDSGMFVPVSARYIRIYAVSGDGSYSVSELEVYVALTKGAGTLKACASSICKEINLDA